MSNEEIGRHAAQGHCVVIGFTEDTGFCGLMAEIADDWTDAPVEVRIPRGRLIGAVAIAIAVCAWLLPRH